MPYKAYTDSDGNFAEIIDGTLYVTKQYDTQISEETNMRSARTGLSVDGKELSVSTVTDKFGRKTAQSVSACQPENTNAPFAAVTANYTYKQYQKNGESMAGSRIDTITNTVKATGKADSTPYTFAYEYDENNNITREYAVNNSGKKTLRYRYTYDEANQLVRADDNVAGKTYVYAYNKGGNRISVKTYAYTLGTELGEAQKTNLALYGDLIWRDRMTSFNEDVVVYDSIGNPISYNGNTYTWEGRQLKSISNNSGKTEFFYDADGLRTETRVMNNSGSVVQTDKYIWQDGKMISHTLVTSKKSETVRILYDSDSQPRGYITDSGETVLFVKNLQGDVIALVDGNGKVAVEYSYDAWGNMTYTRKNGTSYSAAERLVELCPITYRGYNYDFSTGLYYLQSRYYNPEWGRFMNVDDTSILLSTQGETHGANLFAYADNNPVNRVDYTGDSSISLNTFIFYMLIPVCALAERLKEINKEYVLEKSVDLFVTVQVDPSGVLYYKIKNVITYAGNGLYIYEEAYHIDYYYGSREAWETFLDQNKRTYIMAALGMKATDVIKDIAFASALLPIDESVLSLVSFVTADPLNRYVKTRRKFIDNSQAVLRAIRIPSNNHSVYCYALGTILWIGVQQLPEHRENIYTEYKGDTEITVLW